MADSGRGLAAFVGIAAGVSALIKIPDKSMLTVGYGGSMV
jgi:hypothetical protein